VPSAKRARAAQPAPPTGAPAAKPAATTLFHAASVTRASSWLLPVAAPCAAAEAALLASFAAASGKAPQLVMGGTVPKPLLFAAQHAAEQPSPLLEAALRALVVQRHRSEICAPGDKAKFIEAAKRTPAGSWLPSSTLDALYAGAGRRGALFAIF
jgi:hypothetical protein